MRITGGLFRGRKFSAPKTTLVRPTTDRAREGIFSALGCRMDFDGSHMLDLFCGSGAVSLEFLSRGGAKTIAVDQYPKSLSSVRKAMCDFNIEKKIHPIQIDLFSKKATSIVNDTCLAKLDGKIDLVFADPPYALVEKVEQLFVDLSKLVVLDCHALYCLEHPTKYSVMFPLFEKLASYKYGDTSFSILVKKDQNGLDE